MAGNTLFREGPTCALSRKKRVGESEWPENMHPLGYENELKIEKLFRTSSAQWNNKKRKSLTFSKQRTRVYSTLDCMQA
jgi:hypothetical protein